MLQATNLSRELKGYSAIPDGSSTSVKPAQRSGSVSLLDDVEILDVEGDEELRRNHTRSSAFLDSRDSTASHFTSQRLRSSDIDEFGTVKSLKHFDVLDVSRQSGVEAREDFDLLLFGEFDTDTLVSLSDPFLDDHVLFVVAVHTFGMISYTVRAIALCFFLHGSSLEVIKASCMAALYLLSGVVLPLQKFFVAWAPCMRRMLIVRHIYKKHKDKGNQVATSMTWIYNNPWPIILVLALVAPIISIFQMFWERPDEHGNYNASLLTNSMLVGAGCWLFAMLSGGVAKADRVLLDASRVAMLGVLEDMKTSIDHVLDELARNNTYERDLDDAWKQVAKKVLLLDELLEEAWSLQHAGGVCACRISVLIGASFVLSGIGAGHPYAYMRWLYRAFAFLYASAGLFLLSRLALVTRHYMDTRSQGVSIKSTSMKYVDTRCADSTSYHSFMMYLSMSESGVQFAGKSVTIDVVLNLSVKVLVYAPVAIALLGHFLYG